MVRYSRPRVPDRSPTPRPPAGTRLELCAIETRQSVPGVAPPAVASARAAEYEMRRQRTFQNARGHVLLFHVQSGKHLLRGKDIRLVPQ